MSNIIVMAFSPRNIVGCLLKKKGLQRGGHGHPRTPPPSLRPCGVRNTVCYSGGMEFCSLHPSITEYWAEEYRSF